MATFVIYPVYPNQGDNVPGGGNFFMWGGASTSSSITADNVHVSLSFTAPASGNWTPIPAPGPMKWAIRIDSCRSSPGSVTGPVTVTLNLTDDVGNVATPKVWTFNIGAYYADDAKAGGQGCS
jgi:hypothetical protein